MCEPGITGDFLFIDGNYSYDGVDHDFEAFRPCLTDGAIVAFHDSAWEHYRDRKGDRPEMGVPRYLALLKSRGFQSVTFSRIPGLTPMQRQSDGFSFLNEWRSVSAVATGGVLQSRMTSPEQRAGRC